MLVLVVKNSRLKMSGQWELVGKKRDKTSKLPVPKNNSGSSKTKKVPVNNLNLEEICKYYYTISEKESCFTKHVFSTKVSSTGPV